MKKIDAGTVWGIIGIAGTIISLVAGNKKEESNLDKVAEKAADIMEKRQSRK